MWSPQLWGVRDTGFRSAGASAGAVLALMLLAAQAFATPSEEPKRVKLRLQPIASIKGADLYRTYCVQCHGAKGKGDGKLATLLRTPPRDLTQIARRHGGEFPRASMTRYIMGDRGGATQLDKGWEAVVVRGGKADDMPPWYTYFALLYPEDRANHVRFGNLVQHVESLQVK